MELLRERDGMITYRDGDVVVKESKDDDNKAALANAYRFFRALAGCSYIPELVSYQPGRLSYEYIEETNDIDPESARHNVVHLLATLRLLHIIHGDLTFPNFVLRNNTPVVYDWDQAIFTHEAKPQKRPKTDSMHIWPAIVAKAGDPSRVIRRWVACMPHLEYYFGWGTMLDLGTHMGDFPAMASVLGISPIGVDGEYIRPCINQANSMWPARKPRFIKADIVDYLDIVENFDIIMMFSTWPYIIQQHGIDKANWVLSECIERSDIFLFETQYARDGPGPDCIKNDTDAQAYVKLLCPAIEMTPVISIPVDGRDATRTTWKITKL